MRVALHGANLKRQSIHAGKPTAIHSVVLHHVVQKLLGFLGRRLCETPLCWATKCAHAIFVDVSDDVTNDVICHDVLPWARPTFQVDRLSQPLSREVEKQSASKAAPDLGLSPHAQGEYVDRRRLIPNQWSEPCADSCHVICGNRPLGDTPIKTKACIISLQHCGEAVAADKLPKLGVRVASIVELDKRLVFVVGPAPIKAIPVAFADKPHVKFINFHQPLMLELLRLERIQLRVGGGKNCIHGIRPRPFKKKVFPSAIRARHIGLKARHVAYAVMLVLVGLLNVRGPAITQRLKAWVVKTAAALEVVNFRVLAKATRMNHRLDAVVVNNCAHLNPKI